MASLKGIILMWMVLAALTMQSCGARGCLSYGHMCLGGHGKRSAEVAVPYGTPDEESILLRENGPYDNYQQQNRRYKIIDLVKNWINNSKRNRSGGEDFF